MLIYAELISSAGDISEKVLAINMYAGVGYHLYKSIEEDLDTKYHPPATDDFDIIAGANFIINWQFSIDLRVYVYGTFTVMLSICMFG